MRVPSLVAGIAGLCATVGLVAAPGALQDDISQGPNYRTPPQVIIDILDATPTPQTIVSPTRDTVVLIEQPSMPLIDALAQPMHRLAGFRINPRSKAPWRSPAITRLILVQVDSEVRDEILAPLGTTLGWVRYSPDGQWVSYAVIRENGVELWAVDTANGRPRAVTSAGLNAAQGDPCEWLSDSSGVLCKFLPSARGAPPKPPATPRGPNTQEHQGGAAPVRTYQDLLRTAHDEALFEYHFASQLGTVELATGRRTDIGDRDLFADASLAQDGEHLLVERWTRPFSKLVPASRFPRTVEVWTRQGRLVRRLADLPLADAVPIGGVATGPRGHRWHPGKPATVVWVEALDGEIRVPQCRTGTEFCLSTHRLTTSRES